MLLTSSCQLESGEDEPIRRIVTIRLFASRNEKEAADDPLFLAFLHQVFVPSQSDLKSHVTTIECARAIERFVETKFPKLRMSELSRLHGDGLLSFYRKLSPRSRNMYLQKFKQSLNYAVDLEVIDSNPLTRVKPLTVDNRRDGTLSLDQFVSLIRQAKSTDAQDMFLVMGLTGLRPKNVRLLSKDEVNGGRIEIPASKMKNSRRGVIPISRFVQERLGALTPNPLYFPARGSDSTPKSHRNLFRTFQAVRERADLDSVQMYDMRHFFASQMAKQGASDHQVGRLLCHVGQSVTSRYVHHDIEDLRPFVEKLAQRFVVRLREGDDEAK